MPDLDRRTSTADAGATDVRSRDPGGEAPGKRPLVPPVQLTPASSGAVVQRKEAKEMTPAQVKAALEWAASSKIGVEAIKEVQGVCGIDRTGVYDEATAKGVFAKQQTLGLGADGKAGPGFCQRTGLIFTHEITAATVADKDLETIKTRFPGGVTVGIYPAYKSGVSGASEFKLQADLFAKNQQAVGVSGGAVALGQACPIHEVGDVIEVVQSIHRGLVAKWTAAQPATTGSAPAAEPPEYTKVKNLALFSHGESWGVGMNSGNEFSAGGLHNTTRGLNPPNVEAFVRGLSDAVVKSVRVELFACYTGADSGRSEYTEWTKHDQGDKGGSGSFASSMATAFGKDATVSAHTTKGHTTENYAARVFGAEGAGAEGVTLFDNMYPDSFVQSELTRLFADLSSEDRTARHDSLREQMWAHFKDSFIGASAKHYAVPMGQESFTNPDNARALLHKDFSDNWIPKHIKEVKPPPAKK
ncbi:MAG TPA: hypothetical protein VGD80_29345 [Kofleriaceae bacterium]